MAAFVNRSDSSNYCNAISWQEACCFYVAPHRADVGYGWRKPPSLPVGDNRERFDWLAGFVDENSQANFYCVWRNPPLQKNTVLSVEFTTPKLIDCRTFLVQCRLSHCCFFRNLLIHISINTCYTFKTFPILVYIQGFYINRMANSLALFRTP